MPQANGRYGRGPEVGQSGPLPIGQNWAATHHLPAVQGLMVAIGRFRGLCRTVRDERTLDEAGLSSVAGRSLGRNAAYQASCHVANAARGGCKGFRGEEIATARKVSNDLIPNTWQNQ